MRQFTDGVFAAILGRRKGERHQYRDGLSHLGLIGLVAADEQEPDVPLQFVLHREGWRFAEEDKGDRAPGFEVVERAA